MTTEAYRLTLKKNNIKDIRIDLGWSQGQLAKQAHITKTTVRHAEAGEVILRLTARAIWNALNRGRKEQGMSPWEWNEDEWNLRD